MNLYKDKFLGFYHKVKNNNKLLTLAVIFSLTLALPLTVSLSQKVIDIRQRADSYVASITVNPTTAKTGDTITVGWTLGKTTGGNGSTAASPTPTSPTPTTATQPYQTYTEGNYIAAEPNPCVLNSQGTCTVTLSWGVVYPREQGITHSSITVIARESNAVVSQSDQYGQIKVDWITEKGVTFDLYGSKKLLATVFVKGDTYPISHTNSTMFSQTSACSVEDQAKCFNWGYAG